MAKLFLFLGTLMAGLAPQAERMLVEVDFRLSEPRRDGSSGFRQMARSVMRYSDFSVCELMLNGEENLCWSIIWKTW